MVSPTVNELKLLYKSVIGEYTKCLDNSNSWKKITKIFC